MEITIHQGTVLRETTSLVVLAVWEDAALPEVVATLMEPDDFGGQSQQTILLYPREALPARRLLLIGLGQQSAATADTIRQAAAQASQKAHDLQLMGFAMNLPLPDAVSPTSAAQALAEGAELGLYRYLKHKSSLPTKQTHQVEQLRLVLEEHVDAAAAQRGIMLGQAVAHGVMLARDLVNGPGNVVTPTHLGEVAQDIGMRYDMLVTVFSAKELAAQGFGGILAVGQGSVQPPRFIVMDHGSKQDRPTICLVGKGVTFDTGGISIKPAEKMDDMKMDMGGAAAVLGAMEVVGALNLPLHVVGLIGSAENMLSGSAYKPGHVIKTLSGQTVEVLNTDAEGRIVLADALFYAQRYHPQAIVDIATLTGAIAVALGPHAIGLMGNNQELVDRLQRAGQMTAEPVWQLPLWDAYRDMMKSEIADLRNVAGRQGGAIAAAGFLSAFVGDYPWGHLDIAGTAWMEKPTRAYQMQGATGVGVRLLTQMLRDFCPAEE